MKKITPFRLSIVLSALILMLNAPLVFAGTYSMTTDTIRAKDVFAVDVFLDTEGKTLNAVDGTLKLSDTNNGDFEIRDISVAGSALTIWPRKPSLSIGRDTVTFTGGTPVGQNDTKLKLFTLFVRENKPGTFRIEYQNIVGYMSDGAGTAVSFKDHVNTIVVEKQIGAPTDAENTIISTDAEPPQSFVVEKLQDPSLYNGMKFLSFDTSDARSGIDHYEIIEGKNDPVRTGSTYVLQDQNKNKTVTVKAFDKAGNVRVEVYTGGYGRLITIGGVVLLVLVLGFIFRKRIFVRIFKKYAHHSH